MENEPLSEEPEADDVEHRDEEDDNADETLVTTAADEPHGEAEASALDAWGGALEEEDNPESQIRVWPPVDEDWKFSRDTCLFFHICCVNYACEHSFAQCDESLFGLVLFEHAP